MSALPRQIGPFRIVELLHSGGISDDYLAVHDRLQKQVLVRTTKCTAEYLPRVRHTSMMHAGLRHPHVHDVYDYFEIGDDDDYFACVVLKHVEGVTLKAKIEKDGAFNGTDALKLFRQIVAAVKYLHDHDVINGGLKLSNVLLEEGHCYISKFNCAKRISGDPGLPDGATRVGSPMYSAPEQQRGFRYLSPQSDVWALGVMLCELVSGSHPFSSVKQIASGEFELPKTPDGIEKLLIDMVQRDPSDRLPSCAEILREVDSLLLGSLAFVAMPFREEFLPVRESIKRICTQCGVDCYIGDEDDLTGDIVAKIHFQIQKAGFVIADVSPHDPGQAGSANTNVVYEVGLAHGYGKPVILITQDISTLSFDLSRETAIVYSLEDLGAMESKMQGFIHKIVSNPRPVIRD